MHEFQANEQTFTGYLAVPPGGSGPGVLVLHAWWGLTPFFQGVCDRLAAAGFVALAPDLYQGATTATIGEAERLSGTVDEAVANATIVPALVLLRDHPAVRGAGLGVVGFSLGAYWALWLADRQPADLAAVVLFYGTGQVPAAEAHAAFLGHFAANDDFEPAADVHAFEEQLRGAGHAVTFHSYPDTGHWFVESNRPDAYNAEAAALAWDRTLEFLHTHLD